MTKSRIRRTGTGWLLRRHRRPHRRRTPANRRRFHPGQSRRETGEKLLPHLPLRNPHQAQHFKERRAPLRPTGRTPGRLRASRLEQARRNQIRALKSRINALKYAETASPIREAPAATPPVDSPTNARPETRAPGPCPCTAPALPAAYSANPPSQTHPAYCRISGPR